MKGGTAMRSRYKACVRAVLVLCLAASSGRAQGTREDYQRAQQFLPGNLRHRVYVADVTPHWIAEKNRFWYRKAGMKGTEFILVDPAQNTFGAAFDHERLAISLAKAAKREVQPTELPFDAFDYAKDGKSISFQVDGTTWTCQLENYECKKGPERVAGRFTNLQFVPTGQLRPKAFTVVYPLPGEVLPKAEPIIFDVQKGKRIDVKTASL